LSPKFKKIKEFVLGKSYDLSFAFLTPVQMRKAMQYKKLTKAQLHKTPTSNVLSFPLSKTSGEILICKSAAKPYTPEFLFIHGLLHLKGLQHGGIMEHEEAKLVKKFGVRAHE